MNARSILSRLSQPKHPNRLAFRAVVFHCPGTRVSIVDAVADSQKVGVMEQGLRRNPCGVISSEPRKEPVTTVWAFPSRQPHDREAQRNGRALRKPAPKDSRP